MIKNIGQLNFN